MNRWVSWCYLLVCDMWINFHLGFGNPLRSCKLIGYKISVTFLPQISHGIGGFCRYLGAKPTSCEGAKRLHPTCQVFFSHLGRSGASHLFGQRPPRKHEKGWIFLMDGVRSRRPHAASTTPMTLEQRSGNFPKVHQINKRCCELKTNDPSDMVIGHNNWVLVLQCGSMAWNCIHS